MSSAETHHIFEKEAIIGSGNQKVDFNFHNLHVFDVYRVQEQIYVSYIKQASLLTASFRLPRDALGLIYKMFSAQDFHIFLLFLGFRTSISLFTHCTEK